MKNVIATSSTIVLLMSLAATPGAMAQAPLQPPSRNVLSLTANASIDVDNDLLSITFSTTREDTEAGAVQAQLKQALDAALAEAKRIAQADQVEVQTGNFSLSPRFGDKGRITGWRGMAELKVEGKDVAAISALTGRITTLSVQRVSFGLSREARRKVEGEAASRAITAFRAKAAEYAKGFGFDGYDIGDVNVSTDDAPSRPYPVMRMQAQAKSADSRPLPVEAGKGSVGATVSGSVHMK